MLRAGILHDLLGDAGRVHFHLTGQRTYPLHGDVLNSQAVAVAFSRNGTYLLPAAFPEGSPTHPAYGAGHATVAGACVSQYRAERAKNG